MNTLLKELLTEGKRKRKVSKTADVNAVPDTAKNNFAAKHSVNKPGAGAHVDKNGPKAPRNRQKHDWKKDTKNDY